MAFLLFWMVGCWSEGVASDAGAGSQDPVPNAVGEILQQGSPERAVLLCPLDAEGQLPVAPEGAFLSQGVVLETRREACTASLHATAGAGDSVLGVSLSSWGGNAPVRLSVIGLSGEVMAGPSTLQEGEGIEVFLEQSGEVFVLLEPTDPDEPALDYGLEVHCSQGCEREYTRYPVVLLHGLGGAESFGEVEYFYRVRETLEPDGYGIHCPSVTAFGSTELRAEEWEVHLDALAEAGVGRRFNLVGHSQGGLDARYLVGGLHRADLVASVVTVGTPHRGTPVADLLYGFIEDETVDEFWVDMGAEAFALFFGMAGEDNSLVEAMGSLSTEAMADFNARVPDDERVYYASWAGSSCGVLDFSCQEDHQGEIVDPLLAIPHFILWLLGEESDGMVPVMSARWGDHQGEIDADHADEVGLFQDTASGAFDHLAFYKAELRRLADRGL